MHGHRQCLVILTTFYHMCHLLLNYSATGDVVKVVYLRRHTILVLYFYHALHNYYEPCSTRNIIESGRYNI